MVECLADIVSTNYVPSLNSYYRNAQRKKPKHEWMTDKTELAKQFLMAAEEADKHGPFIIDSYDL